MNRIVVKSDRRISLDALFRLLCKNESQLVGKVRASRGFPRIPMWGSPRKIAAYMELLKGEFPFVPWSYEPEETHLGDRIRYRYHCRRVVDSGNDFTNCAEERVTITLYRRVA